MDRNTLSNNEERILLILSDHQKRSDNEKVNELRNKIIQSIAQNMYLYGITDSIGRLYGTLYFSNGPMNLDEMREALGMSKTSMSTGVRALLETKMVKKVWKKGERKDLYQTEEDWYKTFFDYFSTQWLDAIEANLKMVKETEKEYITLLGKDDLDLSVKEQVEMDLKKLDQMQKYYKWLGNLISVFETGEIFNLVPKPEE